MAVVLFRIPIYGNRNIRIVLYRLQQRFFGDWVSKAVQIIAAEYERNKPAGKAVSAALFDIEESDDREYDSTDKVDKQILHRVQ